MFNVRNQKSYWRFIPCQLCTAGENGLKSCIFFCRNIRGRHPRINVQMKSSFPNKALTPDETNKQTRSMLIRRNQKFNEGFIPCQLCTLPLEEDTYAVGIRVLLYPSSNKQNMLRWRNQKNHGGFIPCQPCTAGENGLKSCIFFCRNIRGRHPRINRWSQHFPSLCHLSFYLDIYRPPNKICEKPWLKNQFWTVHTCTWDWVQ